MPRKTKIASVDAAFKSLIRGMDVPKQKAIDLLNDRLDQLEKLLKKTADAVHKARVKGAAQGKKAVKATGARADSATAVVLGTITRSKKPVDLATLKKKTGFDDKKLQNIVFRLCKLGKIKRVGRGEYEAS